MNKSVRDADMYRGSQGLTITLFCLPSLSLSWLDSLHVAVVGESGSSASSSRPDLYKPGSVQRPWQAKALGNPQALTLVSPGALQIIWQRQFNELEGLGSGS